MSAQRFFSSDWSSVDRLRPRLHRHVALRRHRYRGRLAIVLSDTLSGSNLRLSPNAWRFVALLDGRRSVDAAWRLLVEGSGADAPSQDRVIDLLAQLHAADLLSSDTGPDLDEVIERRRKRAGALWQRNLMAPMSIRIPLFNPDAMLRRVEPWCGGLLGWPGLLLWAVLVIAGLLTAAQHWAAFIGNIPDRVLSAENLTGYALVFVVIKVLHELGHGLIATRFGAPVREFGIMFLVFFPVPYVDATAGNALPDKWHRAAIASAGIIVETAVAALALIAWTWLEPGYARALAHDAVLVAGVSTVLVNGNPLLRFDGYFVLADLLELPNLAHRANKWWSHHTDTKLFGLERPAPAAADWREAAVFALYAPAALVYRVVLSFSIALFVASQYFVAGVLLGTWTLTQSLAMPAAKGLWRVMTGPALRPVRRRAVAVTFGAMAALALLAGFVPVPRRTVAEGVVWIPEEAQIRSESSGHIVDLVAVPGDRVGPGDPLVRMENDLLTSQLTLLEARVRELQLSEATYRGIDPVLTEQAREELRDARERRDVEADRVAGLTVTATVRGTFESGLRAVDAAGRWVNEGDLLGWVLPENILQLRIVLDQAQFRAAAEGFTQVDVHAAGQPSRVWQVRSAQLVSGGVQALPSPALALNNGGAIAVDPMDEQRMTPIEPVFLLDAELPADTRLPPGIRIIARLHHAPEPLGPRFWRALRRRVLDTLDA